MIARRRRQTVVLLRCDVADTGIGIEAEKQTLIFEAFTQSDTSTTRHYGGTGLGLTICRRLIEMMGGAIWVKSELGRGSTFSFTARFGFVPLQEEASPTLNLEALRDLPVLIVDDNATNRKILEGMLHHWNTAPTSVSSAAEALAVLRERHTRGTPFRLVLTDVNMPGVDGFMLCEQIRGIPELADLILVVLTSGDRAGDHSLYKQLGVAAHLLKPVKPSELLRCRVASSGQGSGPASDRHGEVGTSRREFDEITASPLGRRQRGESKTSRGPAKQMGAHRPHCRHRTRRGRGVGTRNL